MTSGPNVKIAELLTPKTVAERLGGAREAGEDGFMCKCPIHNDGKASLWIAPGQNGGLVAYCHAGCSSDDVKAYLKGRNLWPSERGHRSEDAYELECQYRYVNASGQYVFTKKRLRHREDRSKMFPQCIERPDQPNLNRIPKNTEKPLFMADRLANTREGTVIFIVEGEKDVIAIDAEGAVATCHPDGARGTWQPHQAEALRDHDASVKTLGEAKKILGIE